MRGLATSSGFLATSVAVLAIGHSARDTYEMLFRRGLPMVHKPFQLGVRIEQPQEQVNRVQYGSAQARGKARRRRLQPRRPRVRINLFTFCMCAGGYVMPSVSEPGYFSTNGMSLSKRDSVFANSGLMITLEPRHFGSDHPLAGVPCSDATSNGPTTAGVASISARFNGPTTSCVAGPPTGSPPSSYPRGVIAASLAELVPPQVVDALHHGLTILDRKWKGQFLRNATLVGPEARGSAPVRFLRDEQTLESPAAGGLYPIGEGAGYAGGIVSAALDGLRAAKAIMRRYAPLERANFAIVCGAGLPGRVRRHPPIPTARTNSAPVLPENRSNSRIVRDGRPR